MKTIVASSCLVASIFFASTVAMADPNGRGHWDNNRGHSNRPSYSDNCDNNDQSRSGYWNHPRGSGSVPQGSNPRGYENSWGDPRPYGQYGNSGNAHWEDVGIQQGIRDGRLSAAEIQELRKDQWDIARKEAGYWQDGRLTQKERDSLKNARDDYRRDLQHELNDGERRW